MSILRQWKLSNIFSDNHRHSIKPSNLLTVMQWNILADGLAQDGKFDGVEMQYLSWKYRLPLIIKEIRTIDPDIFCIEELNRIETLSVEFNDYYVLWAMKLSSPALKIIKTSSFETSDDVTDSDKPFPPDGSAIFLRRSRFEILKTEILHFSQYDANITEVAESYEIRGSTLSNQNAIIAIVKDKNVRIGDQNGFIHINNNTSTYFIIAVTHLKSKKGFEKERQYQSQQLISRINKLSIDWGNELFHQSSSANINFNLPVIICGDFNDVPSSLMYSEIINYGYNINSKDDTKIKTIPNWINFQSSYGSIQNSTVMKSFESNRNEDSQNIKINLKKQRIDISEIENELNINSCSNYQIYENEPLFTTWKFRKSIESKYTGDYIFYYNGENNENTKHDNISHSHSHSAEKNNIKLQLHSILELPNENELLRLIKSLHGPEALIGLPHAYYPSDHISLVARFGYTDHNSYGSI